MTATAADLKKEYKRILLDDIIPFWMKHGIDRDYGGTGNIIDEEGKPLGHDKYLWSQGRALWTFSELCMRFGENAEWREFADHIFKYIKKTPRDENGRWPYLRNKEGEVLTGASSIYVDGFVIAGLNAYADLAENSEARIMANASADIVLDLLAHPGSYDTAPYSIPEGTRCQGVAMLFCWVLGLAGKSTGQEKYIDRAKQLACDILDVFPSPEHDLMMEYKNLDGSLYKKPLGKVCIPGHSIEALWMAMQLLDEDGRMDECCRRIQKHIEAAWDEKNGGLFLALSIDDEPPAWKMHDCKAWWVHCEALVASMICFERTSDTEFLKQHNRIREYTLSHFPTLSGEWRQWLDREGNPAESAALPVKDPFHLPRALMLLSE